MGGALEAFANLKRKLIETSTGQAGARILASEAGGGIGLDLEDLDKAERLLSEARGIHEGI
jgi:hypothetical protein